MNKTIRKVTDAQQQRADNFRYWQNIPMGQPPWRVDIIQRIDAVAFDEAWQTRVSTLVNE